MIVLLCDDLAGRRHGVDLDGLTAWLRQHVSDVDVRRIPGPCQEIGAWLEDHAAEVDRAVLGTCVPVPDRAAFQARLRRVGIDPGGVHAVVLGGGPVAAGDAGGTLARSRALLAGALARVQAHGRSRPENLKPVLAWRGSVGRRALFTVPPVRYDVVPGIVETACAADAGCRLCARSCPHGALQAQDGVMVLDKTLCTGCGACVPACPREAIVLPGASIAQLEGQLRALVAEARGGPDGVEVVFACERRAAALVTAAERGGESGPAWLPIEVPCASMIPAGWLLGALRLGAARAWVLPCLAEPCRSGGRDAVEQRVDYCRRALELLGQSPDRVSMLQPAAADRRPLPCGADGDGMTRRPAAAQSFVAPGGAADALMGLAGGVTRGVLAHPESPVGTVDVGDGCTMCGACAEACPTAALALDRQRDGVALVFDARRCVGCGVCVPVCPEHLVTAERVTDLRRLARGRAPLAIGREGRCQTCGAPVAPRALLDRIATLLADDPAVVAATRRCLACRELGPPVGV